MFLSLRYTIVALAIIAAQKIESVALAADPEAQGPIVEAPDAQGPVIDEEPAGGPIVGPFRHQFFAAPGSSQVVAFLAGPGAFTLTLAGSGSSDLQLGLYEPTLGLLAVSIGPRDRERIVYHFAESTLVYAVILNPGPSANWFTLAAY